MQVCEGRAFQVEVSASAQALKSVSNASRRVERLEEEAETERTIWSCCGCPGKG